MGLLSVRIFPKLVTNCDAVSYGVVVMRMFSRAGFLVRYATLAQEEAGEGEAVTMYATLVSIVCKRLLISSAKNKVATTLDIMKVCRKHAVKWQNIHTVCRCDV